MNIKILMNQPFLYALLCTFISHSSDIPLNTLNHNHTTLYLINMEHHKVTFREKIININGEEKNISIPMINNYEILFETRDKQDVQILMGWLSHQVMLEEINAHTVHMSFNDDHQSIVYEFDQTNQPRTINNNPYLCAYMIYYNIY